MNPTASFSGRAGTLAGSQFYALTKPRVVQLIVFCALIGMVLAVPGCPSLGEALAGLALRGHLAGGGAAAAFNCLVEQGIDARMKRTAWRPTAKGRAERLADAAVLGRAVRGRLGAAVRVGQPADDVADARHLRRLRRRLHRDPEAADAAEHRDRRRLGRHAAGAGLGRDDGRRGAEALILFLIIFLWTPPHFWALALYRVEDYRKSGLPMLPVTHGNEFTRLQMLLYTLVLFAACLLPFAYRHERLAVPGRGGGAERAWLHAGTAGACGASTPTRWRARPSAFRWWHLSAAVRGAAGGPLPALRRPHATSFCYQIR
jgi:protoheme IX farnesyltransferase